MDKRIFLVLFGLIILVGSVLGIRILLKDNCEPPEITISPLKPEVGQAVTFTCINADENITWDFGDKKTSSGKETIHVYDGTGSFLVKATAGECENTKEVVIMSKRVMTRISPTVSFPSEIHANESINFSESTSEVSTWNWKVKETNESSEAQSFNTVFKAPGVYSISLSIKGPFITGDTNFAITVLKEEIVKPTNAAVDKRKEEAKRIADQKKREEAIQMGEAKRLAAIKKAEEAKLKEEKRKAKEEEDKIAREVAKLRAKDKEKAKPEPTSSLSDADFNQKFVSYANEIHDDPSISELWKSDIVGAADESGTMKVIVQNGSVEKTLLLENFKNAQITSSKPYNVTRVKSLKRNKNKKVVEVVIEVK